MRETFTSVADIAPLRRFQPYPAYKDSGVEWRGAIPAHWNARRLKFLAPVRISKLDSPEGDFYVRSGPGSVRLAPESAKEYIRTRFR